MQSRLAEFAPSYAGLLLLPRLGRGFTTPTDWRKDAPCSHPGSQRGGLHFRPGLAHQYMLPCSTYGQRWAAVIDNVYGTVPSIKPSRHP